jgi:hypothetical protein
MSAHDGICKHCGESIWGVDISDDEILWYHKPPGFPGPPGKVWGKNFADLSRKHCKGNGGTVAER